MKKFVIVSAIILLFSISTNIIYADYNKVKAFVGLLNPEDEQYLTGTISDKDRMVKSVFYEIPEIKQTIEAKLDEHGYIYFNTESAIWATKEAMVRIITLVCTPIECIKSGVNIRLHLRKGFIKPRDVKRIDMQFGDEIEPIQISDLYTVGNTQETKEKEM